jgi:hypothetical protein
MGAEFCAKFLCNLCSICWSNHLRAFVGMVEGKLLSNACIQMFVHFELFLSRVSPRDIVPRHATSASPPYRRVRMMEQARGRRSKAGLREHCVPTGRDTPPTPRLVPCGRGTHARAAFCQWSKPRRTLPTTSVPMPLLL